MHPESWCSSTCGSGFFRYGLIDPGEVRSEGKDGLTQHLIKVGLRRGLQAELSEHLGYENGDPDAGEYPNSRNGSSAEIVRPVSVRSS